MAIAEALPAGGPIDPEQLGAALTRMNCGTSALILGHGSQWFKLCDGGEASGPEIVAFANRLRAGDGGQMGPAGLPASPATVAALRSFLTVLSEKASETRAAKRAKQAKETSADADEEHDLTKTEVMGRWRQAAELTSGAQSAARNRLSLSLQNKMAKANARGEFVCPPIAGVKYDALDSDRSKKALAAGDGMKISVEGDAAEGTTRDLGNVSAVLAAFTHRSQTMVAMYSTPDAADDFGKFIAGGAFRDIAALSAMGPRWPLVLPAEADLDCAWSQLAHLI